MSFRDAKSVWMNGEVVPWTKANIHVSSHTLHYGSGVFEGVRCYATDEGPAVFRLEDHINRLFASAHAYGIDIPYSRGELGAAVCQTIAANELESCYARPIVFFGSATLSLNPRSCPVEAAVLAWPWNDMLGAHAAERGVRISVSSWRKFGQEMMPTTAKACGQYVNSILAVREAAGRGYDEALLLNSDGAIAEGAGENLFLVRDGVVHTNDERHCILMGITRDSIITIARDLGYGVATSALTVDDLMTADEAFFSGTAAEVAPIREVDGVPVGKAFPGPVTRAVQRAFFDATRARAPRYRRWLHFVDECTFAGAATAVPCI